MISIQGVQAMVAFELRRAITLQRLATTVVLILFPPLMLSLMVLGPRAFGEEPPRELFPEFPTVFLLGISCILSLLLWATPNVYSEMESKGWSFIACRPKGRTSLLVGKYIAAVVYSYLVCLLSSSLCTLAAYWLDGYAKSTSFWISLNGIFGLACIVYGAIFSLIGVLFQKRGMVFAAGYALLVELILGFVPAVINRFTMRYHLQYLAVKWFDVLPEEVIQGMELVYGPIRSNAFHISVILGAAMGVLFVANLVIQRREYVTAEDV
ncbi:MAG: ABC transporter permease [Planctomycetales bacterium]|nr:ABC transporter permease [Planctomycetales bacterium]